MWRGDERRLLDKYVYLYVIFCQFQLLKCRGCVVRALIRAILVLESFVLVVDQIFDPSW